MMERGVESWIYVEDIGGDGDGETIGSGFTHRKDAEAFKEWLEKDITQIGQFIEWDYDPKIHHLVVHDAPLGTC